MSIFALLLIPLMVIGLMGIYVALENMQRDNAILKGVISISEIRLSQQNRFLSQYYGLTAYHDDEQLLTMLAELFPKEVIFIEQKPLHQIDHFKESLINSAAIVVLEGISTSTVSESKAPVDTQDEGEPWDESKEKSEKPKLHEQLESLENVLKGKASDEISEGAKELQPYEQSWKHQQLQKPITLSEGILIKEYALQVLKSHDKNCPTLSKRMSSQEHRASQIDGEVEYLIFGHLSDASNLKAMKTSMMVAREVVNIIHLTTSPEKMSQVSHATMAFPPPWNIVTKALLIAVWSGAESYVDVQKLVKGEAVPIIKTNDTWQLSIDALLSGQWLEQSTESKKEGLLDNRMYYGDYLRVFLYAQPSELVLRRTMDIVDANLRLSTQGAFTLENFSTGHTINIKREGEATRLTFVNGYE